MPEPPSVEAEPPRQSRTSATPLSSAARATSPVPRVLARSGCSGTSETPGSPVASASSTTAVRPSGETAHRADVGRPIASTVATVRGSAPQTASSASRVPSPPSAMGRRVTTASGAAASTPSATAEATSDADRLPLNESGQTTTRSGSTRRS
jgi:hypothetical protein